MFKTSYLFFVSIFILISCSNKVSVEEFVNRINQDKDFNKVFQDSSFRVECRYKPSELVALTDLRAKLNTPGGIDISTFKQVQSKFSNALYFSLKVGLQDHSDILQTGVHNQQQYAVRLNDLTFNMNHYFYLLTESKDTIRPTLFDFQRSYGMSPDASFFFAFPSSIKNEKSKNINLVYDGRLFGIEKPVMFQFETKELNKELPEIIFKNN